MLIDPDLIVRHGASVVALTAVVIAGKVIGVSLGAFLAGNGTRTSMQAGMSLAQIGEFSFIIAALGLSLGATREFLYPVAVAVSALTTLTTPWLIRASGPAASLLDLRGLTGAIVLAIRRGEESVMIPTAREVLRAGDVVALAGTQDSLRSAASLLRGTDRSE